MYRLLMFTILAALTPCGPGFTAEDTLNTKPERTLIDLEYCGLDGTPGEMRYNVYLGYGYPGSHESSFINSLNLSSDNVHILYHPYLKGNEYSAVLTEGDKSMALYFDLDADGKFTANEKIAPIKNSASVQSTTEFVTPDITFLTADGRKVPYRLLLRDRVNGDGDHSFMWSPSCVWKGKATMQGKEMEVLLFDMDFNGSFAGFGNDSIAMVGIDTVMHLEGHIPRESLSRIVRYGKQFLRVNFKGSEDSESFCIELVEDRTPVGALSLSMETDQSMEKKLQNVRLNGTVGGEIQFDIQDLSVHIPEGSYRVKNAYLHYETNAKKWMVSLSDGPEIEVRSGETSEIALGNPKLTVTTIEETNRWNTEEKSSTEFAAGDPLYISRKLSGVSGEAYGQFNRMQKADATGSMVQTIFEDIEPKLRILDSEENVVVEKTLAYG